MVYSIRPKFDSETGMCIKIDTHLITQMPSLFVVMTMPEFGIEIVRCDDTECSVIGWLVFNTEKTLFVALQFIAKATNIPIYKLYRAFLLNDAIYTVFEKKWLNKSTATIEDVRRVILANPPIKRKEYTAHLKNYGCPAVLSLVNICNGSE